MTDITQLAETLHAAHRAGQRFGTLQRDGQALSTAQAYAVQDAFVDLLQADSGSGIAGYKIGLTSAAMQAMCGIASPVHGRVLVSRVLPSGTQVDLRRYGRLGIECEVAVRLKADLGGGPHTLDEVARHVDAVCPAFELVDDRDADYTALDAATLIADNAWNAGVVLGEWQALPADLASRGGQLSQGGMRVDQGRVGDALDHPLASVGWLAHALSLAGRTLQAGMLVMTGSIVKTRFAAPGEVWRYTVDGLGAVEVAFDAAERRPD